MIVSEPQLIERLAVWAARERIPLLAHFGLTRHCNLTCGFCFWGEEVTHRAFMSHEVFQKALEELSRMGTFEIELTGGEATLHRNLPDFIALASQLRFVITITTNGLRLSEKSVSAMADGLVANVSVSVHGAKPETHDRLVGHPGAWERVIRNIRRLISEGVRVSACFVVNKENYQEIAQAREFFASLGAGFHLVVKIYNPYRLETVESMKLRGEEMREVVRLFPDPPVCPHPCGAFMNSLYVAYNGDVWPCMTLPITMGNLARNTIQEIWEGLDEKSGSLLEGLAREREKGYYRGVDYFCPSMSVAYDGSLSGLDPYVKEIIDLWLAERDGKQESEPSVASEDVPSEIGSVIPEISEDQTLSPASDVALRLLEGSDEVFLLFWKKSSKKYIAVEGPWAESVHLVLQGKPIASSMEILESSFEGFDRGEALRDMMELLSKMIQMGFVDPPE